MTINFLTITDPHFAGVGPKAYLPNPAAYKQDQLNILAECAELAKEHQCHAVLMPGDLTNSHIMSTAVLREFAEALKKFPCPVLTVAGNHDRETSNLDDLKAAPYGVLEATGVIKDINNFPQVIGTAETRRIAFTGKPYSENTDNDIYEYAPYSLKSGLINYAPGTFSRRESVTTVHLTHGALVPDHPWYITDKGNKTDKDGRKHRYTTFAELAALSKEKLPDIIVNGHNHLGHEATYLPNGTLITNYGSIAHLSRDVGEIKRVLRVGLVTISGPGQYKATPIILKSQRPGHECLNREELVRELERAKTKDKMGEFLSLLGTKREIRVRDARVVTAEAVEELSGAGKLSGVNSKDVRERCLRRLDRVSGAMEAKDEGAVR